MDKTKRSNSKCTAEAQKSHCSGRQVNKDSNTKNFSNADNASFKPGDHTSQHTQVLGIIYITFNF